MFYWNGTSSCFPLFTYMVFGRVINWGQPNSKSMTYKESAEKMTYGGKRAGGFERIY